MYRRKPSVSRECAGRRIMTLFPEAQNVHLIKSCGMIPYHLYKFCGYDAVFVCCRNGDYTYAQSGVKGLKMDFLPGGPRHSFAAAARYILAHAKEFDVLHLYHISRRSILWGLLFKLRNPKGIVYIKTDYTGGRLFESGSFYNLKRRLLSMMDIVSSESEETCRKIRKQYHFPMRYIPNGFYDNGKRAELDRKANVILTAARLGDPEKATDVLLEAFAMTAERLPGWTLRLAGNVNKSFEPFLEDYFRRYPHLRDRIVFTGYISDRDRLQEEYARARVFVLTSSFEGFPTVFPEAVRNGCHIVSTDIPSGVEITRNGKYGSLFPVGDSRELASRLYEVCRDEKKLEARMPGIQEFAYRTYYWPNTCKRLAGLFEEALRLKSGSGTPG